MQKDSLFQNFEGCGMFIKVIVKDILKVVLNARCQV